ncbi:Vault protein inter-alpha-trypsin domain protein [Verrucomicrobia bacterium]|nr:Vault protein inter-alpha-trypsin domain protein [Verrucomicrobiota bacterium]
MPPPLRGLAVPQEELWVITRGSEPRAQPARELPGSGELRAEIGTREIPMPLKHTDVRASISGYIGTVQVTQQFLNPYASKITAVYLFPLPHDSAINEFIMTIGERRIRGIIRERNEAEATYQEAKRQGYVASLLTEERPNVFSQSVANLEPGKEIDVDIKYIQTLPYHDGWYEFVFPMVVGPRFNPPGTTEGIGAVGRGQAGLSGQTSEVSYLKPGERSSHDLSLRVGVDAGVPIEDFECKTHQVVRESSAPGKLTVSLSPTDRVPNRDFVLRYRVAGEQIESSLLTSRDERGSYFTLMLYPPKALENPRRQPLELVFVLDCSGSMSGRPIRQAKAAVERGLHLLEPGDSFQLINFSDTASQLGALPLEATPENVQRALDYLRSLAAGGGTRMLEGIRAALDFPHDPERLRFVCFLTDGYIGNETEVLGEIHRYLGPARIFSFGIGSAVNRYLLDQMARVGRGAVAYLEPHDHAAQIMEDFFARISHPALTDLVIDWGPLQATEVFPQEIPDLFVGRPVVLTGRFGGDVIGPIRVSGKQAGAPIELEVAAARSDFTSTNQGLPSIWAQMKIAELAHRSLFEPNSDLADQVKQVALDYGLLSPFTSFVAVDSTRQTEGTNSIAVPVAVPVPQGVKCRTTVQEQ